METDGARPSTAAARVESVGSERDNSDDVSIEGTERSTVGAQGERTTAGKSKRSAGGWTPALSLRLLLLLLRLLWGERRRRLLEV
jgi:hypothetical protein